MLIPTRMSKLQVEGNLYHVGRREKVAAEDSGVVMV
jgi:hypothetical protein